MSSALFNVVFIPSSTGVNMTTLTFNCNDPGAPDYHIILEGIGKESLGIAIHFSEKIPKNYLLFQNYTNPFNPVTQIRYGLPKAWHVKIVLQNISGERIATLVNEDKTAGYHLVTLNASHLANGVHIYTMITNDIIKMNKLVVLK